MEKTEQTIVVKRVKKVAGGAHGGSWKIAFADFALALMSFFLVLWLIESTTNLEKMAIAGYFSDPTNLGAVGDGEGGRAVGAERGVGGGSGGFEVLRVVVATSDDKQVLNAP